MIKICFYGSCGHSSTVFKSKREDLLFAGCCAGEPGEPGVDGLLSQASIQGQHMKKYVSLEDMLEQERFEGPGRGEIKEQ